MSMWEHLAPMIVGVAGFTLTAYIVRTVFANRRARFLAEMQVDTQKRLLEKFEDAEQMNAYLNSEAGRQFLSSASISVPTGSPYGKILGAVQSGIIFTLIGIAFYAVRNEIQGAYEGFLFLGVLCMALGLGFLLSALATLVLARKWRLINGDEEHG